jgi:hypothetical protein
MKKDDANMPMLIGKYRNSIIALTVVAGIVLSIFSYYLSNVAMSLTGLGLIIWGFSLIFVTSTKMIKASLITSQMSSLTMTLNRLLEEEGFSGNTYFLPPKLPGEQFTQVIENKSGGSKTSIVPAGLHLEALFEEEAGVDFLSVDLQKLKELLVKAVVDKLEIASGLEIQEQDETITVKMKGFVFQEFYKYLQPVVAQDDKLLTCPTVSALAGALAKSTRKKVSIEQVVFSGSSLEVRFRLSTTRF